jgi:hypothetical protein
VDNFCHVNELMKRRERPLCWRSRRPCSNAHTVVNHKYPSNPNHTDHENEPNSRSTSKRYYFLKLADLIFCLVVKFGIPTVHFFRKKNFQNLHHDFLVAKPLNVFFLICHAPNAVLLKKNQCQSS